MNNTTKEPAPKEREGKSSGFRTFLYVLIAIVVTSAGTFLILKVYVFPSEFKPVTLNAKEERVLEKKLERLGPAGVALINGRSKRKTAELKTSEFDSEGRLVPERYSEEGAKREVVFSERELNALLAKNTDLASKLAIDLSDDLVSAKLLVPIDEDFPVMGGQILRVRAGLELAYDRGKPIVIFRGVSVMGVPLPSAWLGGLKNIDLVKNSGDKRGFWASVAAGVEEVHVVEGKLTVKLKE